MVTDDRATWANPLRAQRLVEQLEKRLASKTTVVEPLPAGRAEPPESSTDSFETPD
jgi:hypothetical protein